MRQRVYSSEAVVLGRKIYGEADRILVVFSKHFGKLKLLAKGVRRPRSRKRGHIELFTHLKFSAAKSKGIDLISEAEIINNFTVVRGDIKKTALAYYFVEVIGKITHDEEKNHELFLLLEMYFKKLENTHKLKSLRSEFVKDVLVLLGFWPHGQIIKNVDHLLEEVIERKIHTLRVGHQMLQ